LGFVVILNLKSKVFLNLIIVKTNIRILDNKKPTKINMKLNFKIRIVNEMKISEIGFAPILNNELSTILSCESKKWKNISERVSNMIPMFRIRENNRNSFPKPEIKRTKRSKNIKKKLMKEIIDNTLLKSV